MSHLCEKVVGPIRPWLQTALDRVHVAGIPLDFIRTKEIDHICYRCATRKEYLDIKSRLASGGVGNLIVEGMIAGRPISTVELLEPIDYEGWKIPCIEITCPKPGKSHKVGLEHIEIVVGSSSSSFLDSKYVLLDFVSQHPTAQFDMKAIDKDINADVSVDLGDDIGSVKFHVRPLLEVCRYEKANGLVQPVPDNYFEES
jgi:uncharacterized protein